MLPTRFLLLLLQLLHDLPLQHCSVSLASNTDIHSPLQGPPHLENSSQSRVLLLPPSSSSSLPRNDGGPGNGTKPFAWVMMIYNAEAGTAYIDALRVVIYSIQRTRTIYPIVLLTANCSASVESAFSRMGVLVRRVGLIAPPPGSRCDQQIRGGAHTRLLYSFTKLHIVGLKDFARAAYIEADQLVIKNSDDIFDALEENAGAAVARTGAMAPCPTDPADFRGGNTGVMVFSPSRLGSMKLVAEYLEKFASFDKGLEGSSKGPCFAGEQAFLNRYINEVSRIQCLNRKYNCRRGFADKCCGGPDARIIHWSGAIKPWAFDKDEVLSTSMARASPRPWETCNPPGTKLDRLTGMYQCCQTQKNGHGSSTIWHDWPTMSVDQQAMVVKWHSTHAEMLAKFGALSAV